MGALKVLKTIKLNYKLKKNIVLEGVIEPFLCALNFDLKNLALGPESY